jgi:methyl-accepting chemotaxis protein
MNLFSSLSRRLSYKTTLLVSVVSLFVFAVIITVMVLLQKNIMTEQLESNLERFVQTVRISIEKPMIVGDDEGTREEFRTLEKRLPNVSVFLTDFKGRITYSTEKETEDKDLFTVFDKKPLQSMFKSSLEKELETNILTKVKDKDVSVQAISIPNRPSCHHCHGQSQKILGELVVVQDVSRSMGKMQAQFYTIAGICIAALVFLVLALNIFFRRGIIKPVKHLAKASNQVSSGDLDADFEIKNKDELGDLSQDLSKMVKQLKQELGFSKGILRGMPLPYFVCNMQMKITSTDWRMLDLLGWDDEPINYKGWEVGEFVLRQGGVEDLVSEVLSSGQVKTGEQKTLKNRAGQERVIQPELAPIRNLDGDMLGVFTVVSELTEIDQQRQELEEKNRIIGQAVKEADDVSIRVSSAADELSSQIEEAARGTENQRAMTDDTASAMEQMNATVLEVAKNASDSVEMAENTKQKAEEGLGVVNEAIELINQVSRQANDLASNMKELEGNAQDIESIITTIDDIADQTNLLALNAAIEAARAGEAGSGFAVVADEVRKLAEKTMSATKEVSGYVQSIQQSARKSTGNTEQTVQIIEQGTEKSNASGEVFNQIVEMVEKTSDQVRNIATASEQQSTSSEQINKSTEEINRIATEIAKSMTQSKEAVTDLARLAAQLKKIIEEMQNKG